MAPTGLLSLAESNSDRYRVLSGVIIQLDEPIMHGESAILHYAVQLYRRRLETVRGQANTVVFDPLHAECSFDGVRVAHSYERGVANAFSLRGLCFFSPSVGCYRYEVRVLLTTFFRKARDFFSLTYTHSILNLPSFLSSSQARAVNSIGGGDATIRHPQFTTGDSADGIVSLSHHFIHPQSPSLSLVYTQGLTVVLEASIEAHGSRPWSTLELTCDHCETTLFQVPFTSALRFSSRFEVQLMGTANSGGNKTTNVLTAWFLNGLQGVATNQTLAVDINPLSISIHGRPQLHASSLPTVTGAVPALLDGFRSPVWTTSTSARFLVANRMGTTGNSGSDYGTLGLARYVFRISSGMPDDASSRAATRCMATLVTHFGVLFGELPLETAFNASVDMDLNMEYGVALQQCITPSALASSGLDDRGRVSSFSSPIPFDIDNVSSKVAVRFGAQLGADVGITKSLFAVWVDNSCQVPFVCEYDSLTMVDSSLSGGKEASRCAGGVVCLKSPTCEFVF